MVNAVPSLANPNPLKSIVDATCESEENDRELNTQTLGYACAACPRVRRYSFVHMHDIIGARKKDDG
eukprot:2713900-Rhodomonas_salina.2